MTKRSEALQARIDAIPTFATKSSSVKGQRSEALQKRIDAIPTFLPKTDFNATMWDNVGQNKNTSSPLQQIAEKKQKDLSKTYAKLEEGKDKIVYQNPVFNTNKGLSENIAVKHLMPSQKTGSNSLKKTTPLNEYINSNSSNAPGNLPNAVSPQRRKGVIRELLDTSSDVLETAFNPKNVAKYVGGKIVGDGTEKSVFKTSEAYSDGYQLGDFSKTAGATVADVGINFAKGVGKFGEGIVDFGTNAAAWVGDVFGADEWADEAREKAQVDSVEKWAENVDRALDKYSVLGYYSDAVTEGLGQVGATVATAALGGSFITGATNFLSSAGSAANEAYKEGATDGEAFAYAMTKGSIDAITEAIAGGLGKGVKATGVSRGVGGIDDIVAKRIAKNVNSRLGKNNVEFLVKAAGEGGEELLAGLGTAAAKKIYSEKNLAELLKDENLLEQFIMGTVTSALAQAPSYAKSLKKGTDFATGLTDAEQSDADSMAFAFISALEKDGKKLSEHQKNKIYSDFTENYKNIKKASDKTSEDETTSIDTNPATHTSAEQKIIEEYQASTDTELVKFVEESIADKGSNSRKYELDPVSDKAASDILGLTGVDATGFKTVIEQRIAEHIVERHGENGYQDHSMQNINDIGRMQYVLDNYDYIESAGNSTAYTEFRDGKNRQAKTVRFAKAINGTYYVVEAIPNTKANTAFITSAFMTKKAGNDTPYMPKPNVTSETQVSDIPVTNTISQSQDSVNSSTVIQEIKKDASLDGVGDDFENRKSDGVSSDASDNIIPQNNTPVNNPAESVEKSPYTRENKYSELAKAEEIADGSYTKKIQVNFPFKADIGKYNEKAQGTVRNAVNSGVLNNSETSHDMVDVLAKVSEDKGIEFDFVDNKRLKELGFVLKDALSSTINGVYTPKKIYINVSSPKAWQSIFGHEITHALEGTKAYDVLQDVVIKWAKTRGEYSSRLQALKDAYSGVQGYDSRRTDFDEKIKKELTADLVGDYITTSYDFVQSLSSKHRNVFQKLYDEIKYMLRLVKAGSREARLFESAKHNFDKAYRTPTTQNITDGEARYAILKDINGDFFVDVTEDIFDINNGESVARVIQKTLESRFKNKIAVNGQIFQVNKTTNDEFRLSNSARSLLQTSPQAYNDKLKTIANADEILSAAKNWIGEKNFHIRKDDIIEFGRGNISYRVGNNGYVADILVGIKQNGAAVLYDLVNIYQKQITEAPVTMAGNKYPQRRQNTSVEDIVSHSSQNVNNKLSISAENSSYIPTGDYYTPANETLLGNKGNTDSSWAAQLFEFDSDFFAPLDSPNSSFSENTQRRLEQLETNISNYGICRQEAKTLFENEIAKRKERLSKLKNRTGVRAQKLERDIAQLEAKCAEALSKWDHLINGTMARIEKIEASARERAAIQRWAKQEQYESQAAERAGDTRYWVDKRLGLSYSTSTLRRNLRDIVRGPDGKPDIERADAIYEWLQGKYTHHEAQLNRTANRIKAVFAQMGITKAEDKYIQMLGEYRHNKKTKLKKEDVEGFLKKHRKDIDERKVEEVLKRARAVYDELYKKTNAVLIEQGFKPISYREGYFPHFTNDKQGFFGKLLNWKTRKDEIPTDIAGLTEGFEPSRSYQSFDKHRKSEETDYSFLKGLDTYVFGALDWIYHIEDLQKRRAFESYIRGIHNDKKAEKKIKQIRALKLDAEEELEQIERVYAEQKNPLSVFIRDFHTGTNLLAGKKHSGDRKMEDGINRESYSVMTNISNRYGANVVGFNIGSAASNFVSMVIASGEVSLKGGLNGLYGTVASKYHDDGVAEKSDFLTNRLNKSQNLYKSFWDKASDAASIFMEATDSFCAEAIWRGKYYDNISQGMSEAEAIKNADQFSANVMASRSRGEMPTSFEKKNFFAKVLTQFQLEVNNQFQYMFKDMPTDVRQNRLRNLTLGYMKIFIGSWAINKLYKAILGHDVAFDPIGILEDLLRDLGIIGDDEEETAGVAFKNLIDNLLEEVPFVGNLFGGGRFPIESAIPYGGLIEMVDGIKEDITSPNNGGLKNIGEEFAKPLTYLVSPVGGGQVKKMIEAGKAIAQGGSYKTNNDGEKILQYPYYSDEGAKSGFNAARALLFGKSSLPTAQEWVDSGFRSLSADETRAYSAMVEAGESERESYELIKELKSIKTSEQNGSKAIRERRLLRTVAISPEAKLAVYYNLLASENDDEREIVLDELHDPSAINVILDIKNSEEKQEKAKLLEESTLNSSDKALIYQFYIDKDSENSEGEIVRGNYGKFSDAGLNENVSVHLATILSSLEPLEGNNSVTSAQKWDAVANSGYPQRDILTALQALTTGTEKSREAQNFKLELCYKNNIPLDVYTSIKLNLSKYDSNGNGSYSHEEYKKAIDDMYQTIYNLPLPGKRTGLAKEEKAVLWQIFTGATSTTNNPYGSVRSRDVAKAFQERK